MTDEINKPKTLNEVWELTAENAKRARADSLDDEYFLGIFDGCMSSLAILSFYLGRMEDYIKLCYELEDIPWLVEDSYGV